MSDYQCYWAVGLFGGKGRPVLLVPCKNPNIVKVIKITTSGHHKFLNSDISAKNTIFGFNRPIKGWIRNTGKGDDCVYINRDNVHWKHIGFLKLDKRTIRFL